MAVVAVKKVEEEVYDVIEALIIANKPTYTRTILGTSTTFTYTFLSAYPKDNPSFPIVVLDEEDINIELLNLDGSGEDYIIEIKLDFYAKEEHGRRAIVEGKDSLRATFIGNISTFDTTNGMIPMNPFWDDSNTSFFSDKNQLLNTASVLIKFKLK